MTIDYEKEFGTWAEPLERIIKSKEFEATMDGLNNCYDMAKENRNGFPVIFPSRENIFKAFRDCPYHNLKVIILAEEPYANDLATGVAFAVDEDQEITEELMELYSAMYGMDQDNVQNVDNTLEYLSGQGILFLNSILTVPEDQPLSHFNLWNRFIIELLSIVSVEKKEVIYSLIGDVAISFKPFIKTERNTILEDMHPKDYLEKGRSWNCNHFRAYNFILNKYNKEIQW